MPKRPRPRRGTADRKPRPPQRKLARTPVGSAAAAERPPGLPLPPPQGPLAEAVTAFEAAMKALQRHSYRPAAAGFRNLLEQYPSERGLLDRARVYLELCERELRTQPVVPGTVEEQLTAATAALNNGDETGAERLAKAVLAQDPRDDLALYLLAVIEARRGAADTALSFLEKAVEISPEAGAQARFDGDFESIRDTDRFRRLTDPHANSTPSNHYRRARRLRGER
ncbi:MAG TPA: tetratricopeptide repeat protein [Vicinamibacterales bacterium]|nr:tetratricopeptide repeat protein [Vicinamibacterales bacterium]